MHGRAITAPISQRWKVRARESLAVPASHGVGATGPQPALLRPRSRCQVSVRGARPGTRGAEEPGSSGRLPGSGTGAASAVLGLQGWQGSGRPALPPWEAQTPSSPSFQFP